MFEKASRLKLRFETTRGFLTTEDLWDLNLTSLDDLAIAINKKLKEESQESFITDRSSKNDILELKLNILKHIIEVKLKEKEDKKHRAERAAELTRLKDILASKKDEELRASSVDELKKRIAELEAS